jgi:hypothetical protein
LEHLAAAVTACLNSWELPRSPFHPHSGKATAKLYYVDRGISIHFKFLIKISFQGSFLGALAANYGTIVFPPMASQPSFCFHQSQVIITF